MIDRPPNNIRYGYRFVLDWIDLEAQDKSKYPLLIILKIPWSLYLFWQRFSYVSSRRRKLVFIQILFEKTPDDPKTFSVIFFVFKTLQRVAKYFLQKDRFLSHWKYYTNVKMQPYLVFERAFWITTTGWQAAALGEAHRTPQVQMELFSSNKVQIHNPQQN